MIEEQSRCAVGLPCLCARKSPLRVSANLAVEELVWVRAVLLDAMSSSL